MDKNSIWLLRLAAGVIIITFGVIPIFKIFDNKRKNDIVVKTDLGESYILRDTSLTSFDFTKEDLLKILEKYKLPIEKRFNSLKQELTKELTRLESEPPRPAWMEEKIKGCDKYKTKKQRDYCFNIYTPNSSNLKSQLNKKIKIKELELKRINLKIDKVTQENESLFLRSLKFRPIYKDLNGTRIAQGYEKVACENPKLDNFILKLINDEKGQFSEALNEQFDKFPLSDGYVIPKYDGLALDSLKIEACMKYAKF